MHEYEKKIAPTVREHKWFGCGLELKSLAESGRFSGYASVFHRVDSQKDMVLPGAFKASLAGRVHEIKLLWQHDMREPVGVIETMREDDHGLYIEGRLLMDIARAREAYVLMKEGVISGLSIGYSPRRYQIDPGSGVRLLSAIDLWEISLVTFPANEAARISMIKEDSGIRIQDSEKEIPAVSREWRQSLSAGHVMKLAHELERATRVLQG